MSKRLMIAKGLVLSAFLPAFTYAASMESRIESLENKVAQSTTSTDMDTFGAKNATAMPLNKGYNIYADIGFVYAQPHVGGTDYAVKTDSGAVLTKEEVKKISPKWNWGVVAGFGYKFSERNWDIGFQYLHYKASSPAKTTAGLGGQLLPTRAKIDNAGTSTLLTTATNAASNMVFDNNVLDFLASNSFFMNQKISLQAQAGLRSHWFKFKQNTQYSGGTVLGVNTQHVDDSSKFWGMGPAAGLNSTWYLGNGFAFFSNFSSSFLYGRFQVNHTEKYTATGREYRTDDFFGRTMIELDNTLGLQYSTFFSNNKQHLCLRVGYDLHYYPRMNQVIRNADNTSVAASTVSTARRAPNSSEDVSLHGLLVKLRWDF